MTLWVTFSLVGVAFAMGLVLGITSASAYYHNQVSLLNEKIMARLSRKEAVDFILTLIPKDLADIQTWLVRYPEYLNILLDHFKCRVSELPQSIYQHKKNAS